MRVLILFLALAVPNAAWAEAWSVLPFGARGVDLDTTATFRDLLVAELGGKTRANFVDTDDVCTDVPCAMEVGRALGVHVVVYGRLSRLGENIVVTSAAVDVEEGETLSQLRMSVDRVEDLEKVAARMASAIVEGEDVQETAELGAITDEEAEPDTRREGDSGLALRVGGVMPFGDALTSGFGILFDVGYWYEARDFSIEPYFRYRGAASSDDDERYDGVNFDVAANYILLRGDFAPFVGLGGGLRWLNESRRIPVDIGTSLSKIDDLEEDAGWGPGAFARLGVLLFRTYTMRMALTAQYDATFIELHDDSVAQAVDFAISVIF